MKKSILLVIAFSILSKAFGFTRDIVLSYFYGASNISDAYLISTIIPVTILAMIGAGITTGYIPIYSKVSDNVSSERSKSFTNNLLNITILFSTIVIVISMIFTNQIVTSFAIGFDQETFNLAVEFTRISLIGILFSGIVIILTSFLQVNNKFVIAALIGLPLNIIIIISIILSSKVNLIILPIGSTLALLFPVLFLLPFVKKLGLRYKPVLNLKDESIKDLVKVSLPAIVGISVSQINLLIDRSIASSIAVGGISALSYSNRLIAFVIGIFIAPIITVVYPRLSHSYYNSDLSTFKKHLNDSITSMSILVLPSMIGFLVFSTPIIVLLFGRGEFDSKSVFLTSGALFFYSIGILSLGLREILSRAFYAINDTRTPVTNSIISVVVNIVLNITLSKFMGISGLALATSISAILATILIFISLRRRLGPFGFKRTGITFLKVLFASVIMGILSKLAFTYLLYYFNQNIALLISIFIGALSYFIIIFFMKIDDIDVFVRMLKGKFLTI